MDKIALIGNGYWGSKIKKYIPEFFDLKYVVSSKFDKNIIWNDDNVKGVIIATPMETHYEITKEALLSGKHVFCEKPITLVKDQAEELNSIANNLDLKIGVDYVLTFSKAIEEAINWIDIIGGIDYIEMSTKHLGRFMDFDVYWLLASHHLSVLDMFIDLYDLDFDFKDYLYYNGLCTMGSIFFEQGRIDVSTNFPGKESLINIYGRNGTIKYRPIHNILEVVLYDKKYKLLPDDLIFRKHRFVFDESNNLKHAIRYFKMLMGGKCDSNIDRAIKITEILENK